MQKLVPWGVAAILALGRPARIDAGTSVPHSVLLFIGDGMGDEQVKAARFYQGTPLSFEAISNQCHCTTHSANSAITDSAAAATAIATGSKVNNMVLSLALPGDGSDLETVLEHYQAQGKLTGLVTTSTLIHGTPAAFAAHVANRYNYPAIGQDFLWQTRPDVMMGGEDPGLDRAAAMTAGYAVATNRDEMQAWGSAQPAGAKLAGLFGSGNMPFEYDGLGDLPQLSEMTTAALDLLEEDPDGFFVMIEGGRIDHACHANGIERAVYETIAFGRAVQVGLDWAAAHSNALVLVTADHETGGLTVVADNGSNVFPTVTWSSVNHTGTPVSVYALGPNSQRVEGMLDNTDLHAILAGLPRRARCTEMRIESNSCVALDWTVSSGDTYRLDFSTDLNSTQWVTLSTLTASNSQITLSDTNAPGGATHFYRLSYE